MYLNFYGLKEEPFRLTPDPRFLHLAEPHRTALLAILEGLIYRKGLLVLTGPVGTGKTSLMHAAQYLLTHKFREKFKVRTAFMINPTLTREDFLEALMDELEIPPVGNSKPKRLLAINELLIRMHKEGGTTILIIDEAHLLSNDVLEEIRLLTNFDNYREKLLQVVLCGQPELASVLARREMMAVRQRVAVNSQLRKLRQAETSAYIAERLHVAGLKGPSPFTDAAISEIQVSTQGIPRLINLLSDAALRIGYNIKQRPIEPGIIRQAALELSLADLCQIGTSERPGTLAAGM